MTTPVTDPDTLAKLNAPQDNGAVTDPELLKQLNAPQSNEPVTDPEILKQLNAPQANGPSGLEGYLAHPYSEKIQEWADSKFANVSKSLKDSGVTVGSKDYHLFPELANAAGAIGLKGAADLAEGAAGSIGSMAASMVETPLRMFGNAKALATGNGTPENVIGLAVDTMGLMAGGEGVKVAKGDHIALAEKSPFPQGPMSGEVHDAIATNGSYSGVLNAMDQGAAHDWGAPKFEPEVMKEIKEAGLKMPEDFKAYNGAFLRPAANEFDIAARTVTDKSVVPDLMEAKELNVIGKEMARSPIEDGSPLDAARKAIPSLNDSLNSMVTKSPIVEKTAAREAWEKNFNSYVGKLETTEDAKAIIRESVNANGTFEQARGGEIPAAHLGVLSDISGIPVSEMDQAALRTRFSGPAEFRAATELMLKLNDDVFSAAKAHALDGSVDSAKALTEAMIRNDVATEYVMGLRSEWGKVGNVMQEFMERSKDSQAINDFLRDKKGAGWDINKLGDIAKQLNGLEDRGSRAKYLADMRKPDFLDKAIWWWTNALISGPITHAKYIIANTAYLAHDTLIATPLAGLRGGVRQMLSREELDRVYMGETAMKLYGIVAGTPDALVAAGQAIKNNTPTALPSQPHGAGIANPITNLKPIGGFVGEAVSGPGRVISGIHSFYNFLGYRSELEAQAYRRAIKDGYRPTDPDFWKAQKAYVMTPDDRMMDAATDAGGRANFARELGPKGKAAQNFLYQTRIGRFVMPFTKIPGNIFNTIQEGTPAAYLSKPMRDNLRGRNGAAEADMAYGRLAAGAAVMGTAAYMTLQDRVTGSGPVDPKQRAEWMLTHQPNSIRVGDTWYSFNNFGPIGGWFALGANITDVAQSIVTASHQKTITVADQHALEKDLHEASSRAVTGLVAWLEEGGTMGLFNLGEFLTDPKGTNIPKAIGGFAATWMPYSSMLAQTASFIDPSTRETQGLVDTIKNRIPLERETLPVVRDWTGAPRPNPYYESVVRERDVNTDVVAKEMQRLDYNPAKPTPYIRGVRLSPEQYDEYQSHSGATTYSALSYMMKQPSWAKLSDYTKVKIIEGSVKSAREQAQGYMFSKYPSIIKEATDTKIRAIMGEKHKPTAFQRPGADAPVDE